jgi:hypothetical protein
MVELICGIATGYGLDGRGLIPGRGKIFLHSVQTGSGLAQPSMQWVPWTNFPGVKRQEPKADHSPPSNAEVKNGGAIPITPTSSWHS